MSSWSLGEMYRLGQKQMTICFTRHVVVITRREQYMDWVERVYPCLRGSRELEVQLQGHRCRARHRWSLSCRIKCRPPNLSCRPPNLSCRPPNLSYKPPKNAYVQQRRSWGLPEKSQKPLEGSSMSKELTFLSWTLDLIAFHRCLGIQWLVAITL